MANTLGFYNPPLFANELLIWLQKALGMSSRIHMGFDAERRTFNQGDVINIRRPGTFTATDAPSNGSGGTIQDVTPDSVQIQLTKHKEVRIAVDDKQLAYTGNALIDTHIAPTAYALADIIDQDLCGLYADIPWFIDTAGTIADFTNAWQRLFDNLAPSGDWHMMLNGALTNTYLQQQAFSQWQGAGPTGVDTQLRGSLGTKFGFETFSNQNVKTQTTTAIGSITQAQVNANVAKGATSLVIKDSDGVLAGTLAKGDTFVIAGNTQRYALTANATAAANLITVTITPPLAQAHVTNDNITIRQATAKAENLAFHRGAFALAMAKLPDYAGAGGIGAQFSSIQDPVTGLSLRYRIGYDNNFSRVIPVVDVLYGVQTLNPNLAVRLNS